MDFLEAAEGEEGAVSNSETRYHPKVTCDVSYMYPIVGPRYKRGEEDYDVCEAVYKTLSEDEKKRYTPVDPPAFIKYTTRWRVLPWLQRLAVDDPEHPRLKAVCEARGIELRRVSWVYPRS